MDGIKLARLFKKTSAKSGNEYYTGRVNAGMRLLILPNTRQNETDSPEDYVAFLVPADDAPAPGTTQ
jgi:hypothetical protein